MVEILVKGGFRDHHHLTVGQGLADVAVRRFHQEVQAAHKVSVAVDVEDLLLSIHGVDENLHLTLVDQVHGLGRITRFEDILPGLDVGQDHLLQYIFHIFFIEVIKEGQTPQHRKECRFSQIRGRCRGPAQLFLLFLGLLLALLPQTFCEDLVGVNLQFLGSPLIHRLDSLQTVGYAQPLVFLHP